MTNYTSAHESRGGGARHGDGYRSLRYPQNHVEVDNRLSWFLGALEKEYGDDAFYVHLLRDREEVATSFLNRWDKRKTNIIFSFAWGILTHPYDQVTQLSQEQRLEVARLYWDTVNSNIGAFLRGKPRQITMWLHDIKEPFAEFWRQVGAAGDLSAALGTWDTSYNASPSSERPLGRTLNSDSCVGRPSEQQSCSVPLKREEVPAHDVTGAAAAEVTTASRAVSTAMQTYQRGDLRAIRPTPKPKGWMMDEETLAFLLRIIAILDPTHVVEFGSGLSTQVVAWACAGLRHPCHLTSIDHDPEFIQQTRGHVTVHVPGASVTYMSAPLVARKIGGRPVPTYYCSREAMVAQGSPDLIVVDGPPRALGGREGVLYQALDIARVGTVILVHDAARQEESAALLRFENWLDGAIQVMRLPGFPKGLAALVVVEPIRLEELSRYRARLTVRDLQACFAPGAESIVIDDGTLPPEVLGQVSAKHFPDRNGEPWGPPGCDEEALHALERLHRSGARYLVFVAESFWWLEYYAAFRQYIESHFTRVLDNERLVVFDMQGGGAS